MSAALVQPSPRSALGDTRNGLPGDAELLAYGRIGFGAVRAYFPDLPHLLGRQFAEIGLLATNLRAMLQLVGCVIDRRGPSQVPRIYARAVPASVRRMVFRGWRLAINGTTNDAMRLEGFAADGVFAITSPSLPVRPNETFVLSTGDGFMKKARAFTVESAPGGWVAMFRPPGIVHFTPAPRIMRLVTSFDGANIGRDANGEGIAPPLPPGIVRSAPSSRYHGLVATFDGAYALGSHASNLLCSAVVRTREALSRLRGFAVCRLFEKGGQGWLYRI